MKIIDGVGENVKNRIVERTRNVMKYFYYQNFKYIRIDNIVMVNSCTCTFLDEYV